MSINKDNIPNKYFEDFPQKIIEGINLLEDDVQSEAPLLFSISQKASYQMPDQYLENFYRSLDIDSKPKTRILRKLMPYVAAASFILLAGFGLTFFNNINSATEDELELMDVYEFYVDNIDEIDNTTLIGMIDEADVEEVDFFEDLTAEEIEMYEEAILHNMTDQELLDIL